MEIITDTGGGGPPKGIIYGLPGSGKTTLGAALEGALILDCEQGAGRVRCHRTPYLSTWYDIWPALLWFAEEDHEYRALVVDTLDWLIRRAEEQTAQAGAAKGTDPIESTLNRSHGGYGNGKEVLRNMIYARILPTFDKIIARGCGVILLAHAVRHDVMDEDGVTVEKIGPDVPPGYLAPIMEWADFCMFLRAAPEGRTLQTQESSRAVAKNRYGLEPIIAADWAAITNNL